MDIFFILVFFFWIIGDTILVNCDVFKIGVILPHSDDTGKPWALPRGTKAGIMYAVDTIHKQNKILPNHTLKVTFGDSKCSDTFGPLAAIDMYINKTAQVFLGPACDYAVAPIARFSPHWNIPVITGGALVQAFKDKKDQYKLLTRIGGSYQQLGRLFISVFDQFKWARPGFIYHDNLGNRQVLGRSTNYFIIESIYHPLKKRFQESVGHPGEKPETSHFDEVTGYNATDLLKKMSKSARSRFSFMMLLEGF
jgi:atrial natriuretic peptide receptor A